MLKPIGIGSFEYGSMTCVKRGGNAWWLDVLAWNCEIATGLPAITTSIPIGPPPLSYTEPEKKSSAGPLTCDWKVVYCGMGPTVFQTNGATSLIISSAAPTTSLTSHFVYGVAAENVSVCGLRSSNCTENKIVTSALWLCASF